METPSSVLRQPLLVEPFVESYAPRYLTDEEMSEERLAQLELPYKDKREGTYKCLHGTKLAAEGQGKKANFELIRMSYWSNSFLTQQGGRWVRHEDAELSFRRDFVRWEGPAVARTYCFMAVCILLSLCIYGAFYVLESLEVDYSDTEQEVYGQALCCAFIVMVLVFLVHVLVFSNLAFVVASTIHRQTLGYPELRPEPFPDSRHDLVMLSTAVVNGTALGAIFLLSDLWVYYAFMRL